MIAFVGSVFSPYYAWSGRSDPLNHCAINVALYGPHSRRWAMTERGRAHVTRTPDRFVVGASSLTWQGDDLVIDVSETAAPIPLPTRGKIVVTPQVAPQRAIALDDQGRHVWTPIAPRCAVSLALDQPALRWRGEGYLDSNFGDEPLETGFSRWDWARAHDPHHGCVVAYRGTPRIGGPLDMTLHLDAQGRIEHRPSPPVRTLPSTIWGIRRQTRADSARLVRTFEDAPFYSRSEIEASFFGHSGRAFHESLDLDRFAAPWVRALLPVRMPRRS